MKIAFLHCSLISFPDICESLLVNRMRCVSPDEVRSYGGLHPPHTHTHTHTYTHPHTPPHHPLQSNVIRTCSEQSRGGSAGPGEEKMEYGSSLSVSGWQGFSPTPSHSSNEVIKWMNEPWKETCCWGRCVPKMPLPTPQPFASLYYCGLRTVGGKSSQEDEAISAMCLQHIYQSWVACTQAAYDICLLQLCHRTGARIVGEWRFIISLPSFDTCLIVEVKPVWVAARAAQSSPQKKPRSSNLTLLTMNLANNARKQKSPLSL